MPLSVSHGTAQPIDYTLDEAAQGCVGVSLVSGGTQYCTLFGGTGARDSGRVRLFSAQTTAPPAGRPIPPSPCP